MPLCRYHPARFRARSNLTTQGQVQPICAPDDPTNLRVPAAGYPCRHSSNAAQASLIPTTHSIRQSGEATDWIARAETGLGALDF